MTLKDMDCCLPFLKQKFNSTRDQIRRAGIKIAIDIITALPSVEVEDGIQCKQCYFYAAESKRCCHDKGLNGRVLPDMYCSYGSYHHEETNTDDLEEEAKAFEQFSDD